MSTQVDYAPDEWNVLVHAPAQASTFIMNADKTGGIQGQFGIIQETKDAHTVIENAATSGATELVRGTAQALLQEQSWKDLLKSATPESVTTSLRRANTIVDTKIPSLEAQSYKQFVYAVARRTISSSKEGGQGARHHADQSERGGRLVADRRTAATAAQRLIHLTSAAGAMVRATSIRVPLPRAAFARRPP